MSPPEKPNSGTTPENESTNIETRLGIDKIQNAENREIVKNYFEKTLTKEQRSSLIHEKSKSDFNKLKQQIDSLNQRQASAEEFVQEIITTMQKEALERDMNDGWTDEKGPHLGYIESYFQQAGTDIKNFTPGDQLSPLEKKYKDDTKYDMDWDDRKTFDYCLNRVRDSIRALPLNLKREVRHQFAQDFVNAFTQTVDNFDWAFENFDYDEIPKMEEEFRTKYPQLQPQNFNNWLALRGYKPEEVFTQYNKLDTKVIVDTKSKLENDKKSLANFPKEQQDYYSDLMKNIEGTALSNPTLAQEQIANLEKDMAGFTAFLAFKDELKALRDKYTENKAKYSDLNPDYLTRIDKIQKDYDDRSKQLQNEKNPQKRASLLDIGSDLKQKSSEIQGGIVIDAENFEKKKTEEDKKKEQAVASENPQNAPDDEEPGMLDKAVMAEGKNGKLAQIVKDLASKLGPIGGFILSVFFTSKTLKAIGINSPTSLDDYFKSKGKTPEQVKELTKKANKILKDQFKIESTDELKAMSETSVKDFLKAKPDKFDEARYQAFKASLKQNGATDTTDQKVFVYIMDHVEEWKMPEAKNT